MSFTFSILDLFASFIDVCTGAIVALGVLAAGGRALKLRLGGATSLEGSISPVRLSLGRWLALALELALAADIVRCVVAPTWDEIGKLAAIAALRTALNYFLEKEIERGATDFVTRAA